ncbi:nicalin [Trypanosoma theileri]|uniref:Nicalin n=1 Tax=Trypanosoma theileri TaxID=67003 RepID=A0A1X0NSR2_9TRYP|nr:nicalin [Trypanosoma theileri]ORC87578.1 nicalin [Trypanosoma theileri]
MRVCLTSHPSRLLPLLVLFVLLAVALPATAAEPLLRSPVYHAIHFERRTSTGAKLKTTASTSSSSSSMADMSLGSQSSLLRGGLALFDPTASLTKYRRQTVFLPTTLHITPTQWQELIALPVRGIIAATSPFDTHNEWLLQHHLARAAVPLPVYFLPHDGEAARELYNTLAALPRDGFAVVSVGANEAAVAPVVNNSVTGIHLYASMTVRPKETKGTASSTTTEELPRLLITASFDTLSVAPAAPSTGGATGSVAAMELWRRFVAEATAAAEDFSSSQSSSLSPYGVSVLLGNTARFNYAGTTQWLSRRQEADLDSYQLVLCLDELLTPSSPDTDNTDGEENEGEKNGVQGSEKKPPTLYMHVHDSFAKSPQYAKVKETAEAIATQHGIALTVLSSKTDYHHYDIRFEHEVLAHRQIPAVTFSATRTYRVDQLFRGSRIPIPASLNTTTPAMAMQLKRRVDFIHAFAQQLLRGSDTAENLSVQSQQQWVGSDAYMAGLLRYAAESQRSPLAFTADGNLAVVKYAEVLEAHLKQRVMTSTSTSSFSPASSSQLRRTLSTSVSLSTFRLHIPGVVLIGPYEQVMRVFVENSTSVDLLLLAVTILVVGGFAMMEFGFDKTWRILFDCMKEEGEGGSSSSNSKTNQ